MTTFDVFNGDADGLCSLHQMRLAEPCESVLITGVKRDIALVRQVQATAGDSLNILDVSLDKNREALLPLLEAGVNVRYFDHHFPGEIPAHTSLQAHIDTSATTCTGLIVNTWLQGQFLPWAVTAAFGDNLLDVAREAASPLNLAGERITLLEKLGTLLNYNGYGQTLSDLHFPPAELYQLLKPYSDPFDFIENEKAYATLADGYSSDRTQAEAIEPTLTTDSVAIYRFPDAAFARRIGGVFANELAQRHPQRAHALLTNIGDAACLVSVRAPLSNRDGADELCRQFDTGGGRKAAAGINHLPVSDLDRFSDALIKQYPNAV